MYSNARPATPVNQVLKATRVNQVLKCFPDIHKHSNTYRCSSAKSVSHVNEVLKHFPIYMSAKSVTH